MSRHQREQIAGGTYHVMNRGNRKQPIFEDDFDRRRFLQILLEEKVTHSVEICAGCLMRNHFHLVITTPYENLSEFMALLEGRFAKYFNARYDYVGHLFQGPFPDVIIEDDVQMLTALCYVFFNPVSAGLVRRLEDYRWSTYRATAGFERIPRYLSLDWLEVLFPSDSLAESQQRFRELMANGDPVFAYLHEHDLGVEPDALKSVIRSYVGGKLHVGTLPRLYRSVLRDPLPELVSASMPRPVRAAAIYEAHVVHGYKLVEIAQELRLHPTTVSEIFRATQKTLNAGADDEPRS